MGIVKSNVGTGFASLFLCQYQRNYRHQLKTTVLGYRMKTCTKCNIEKQEGEFHKCNRSKDGLQYKCKPCHKEAVANWRARNPGHDKASGVKWRAANLVRRRSTSTAWQKANPEKYRINNHNYDARKRENGGRLSQGLAEKLFKLQRGKCACGCKQPLGDDYHLDHRMPLALGGMNSDDNMQLLRRLCNQQKSAKHPIDFMQQRGFLL